MAVKNFKELVVWQKSMELTLIIYHLVKHFPKEEMYALTSQICRAAVSIPSNIAEGQGRQSKAEFLNFLSIANGSLAEVNPAYTPCGILIEVAHHDYLKDAEWIMKNKENIGYKIADTILEYWQIK